MKKYFTWKLLSIILVTLFLGFFDLPDKVQTTLVPFTPEAITKARVYLGLDLQGGSQLDYKIDLRKVPDEDRQQIIEGVLEVIERRVNSLGVAEPQIYLSEIANETHIIVELAETATISQDDVDTYLGGGVKFADLTDDQKKMVSLEKAKETVGKTIQLEFKEEKTTIDPQEQEKITQHANSALQRIKDGASFEVVGQEEQQAYPDKVLYETSEFAFAENIPSSIKDVVITLEPGQLKQELVTTGGNFVIGEAGNTIENTGLGILKLLEKREVVKHKKSINASHILISHEKSEEAPEGITRSKKEAEELAKNILKQAKEGADFAELAKKHSDDPGSKELGGTLGTPVNGDGSYVFDFEKATLALKQGEISDIVDTKFGYHIIRANEVAEDVKEMQYKYASIIYSTVPSTWQDTSLTGQHFVHANVDFDQFNKPLVSIIFNDEGGKLFEELTERNVGKPIAIFVGGNLISAPRVSEKIAGGQAQITGDFTIEEAKVLARDLNTGAIPAPIVLTGEYTIGATLGQQALSDSLQAGLIGMLLVVIFMIGYYRIPGLVATFALLAYSSILLFLIKSHLPLILALIVALTFFSFAVAKLLNSKESGWEKFITFVLSCFAFFFITFLLRTGVVVTLAGVAGIILSIGMAVDANILIFERFKEELQKGRTFAAALETGFERAWSAIRDSNFSTLITCGILFYFGSSIIKGFAFNLAAGILVSMLSAIIITRTLLSGFVGTQLAKRTTWFGVQETTKAPRSFNFLKHSKKFLNVSAVMMILSVLSIATFGLNLGIDFKGGTLMEFSFAEPIEKTALQDAFQKAQSEVEPTIPAPTEETGEPTLTPPPEAKLDLSNMQIQESSGNNYIIKTKYLSSELHDQLLKHLETTLPEFTETRFTTIGPVIGTTLLKRALIAIIIALVVIIVYIALAFRKIPKEVSPWRFGACAIAALAHDMLIVTGIFALLGQLLNVEIDALFITAMLTVFGYSVNDTIVVFDRLRENLQNQRGEELEKVANDSLNQTLGRSLNTSLSTLIALLAVLLFGSPSIFYFVLALTLGIIVGTYSSIFTATPLLVLWQRAREQFVKSEKIR